MLTQMHLFECLSPPPTSKDHNVSSASQRACLLHVGIWEWIKQLRQPHQEAQRLGRGSWLRTAAGSDVCELISGGGGGGPLQSQR